MNKLTFLCLLCIGMTHSLFAQSSLNILPGAHANSRHDAVFREALRSSRHTYASKTTSTGERLRAQSTYRFLDTAGIGVNSWMLEDSIYYLYSGIHGSQFDYTDINYWDDFTLFHNGLLGMGTAMGRNNNFYKPDVLFDSAYCFHRYGDMIPYFISRNYFDANDNIYNYSQTFLHWGVDSNNFAYTYDSNRIASRVYTRNNAWAGLETIETRRITYLGGLIYTDSSFLTSGLPDFLYRHNYDIAGRSTRISMYKPDSASTGWYEALRYDFEYTSLGQVSRFTSSYKDDSIGPLHMSADEFATWSSGGLLSSIHYTYYVADTVYQLARYAVHFSPVNGLPDTTIHADTTYTPTGTGIGYFIQTIKYNSLNDPIQTNMYLNATPVIGSDTPWITKYYYYEFPESVNTITTTELKVYPNPAGKELFIGYQKNPSVNINIVIYDLAGRVIKNEVAKNGIVNIAELIPGTYIIILTDNTGITRGRQRFSKI